MNNLVTLFESQGQSPWLDNLRRDHLHDGTLAQMISDGVRGITSNPSIFQQSIEGSDAYDDQFAECIRDGLSVPEAYWRLVTTDIVKAADLLSDVYETSGRRDGFVSLEVAPSLANDAANTLTEARKLFGLIDRPNLMVKIPGTREGMAAVSDAISEGINVNVTLIFSPVRYGEVIDAYLDGLERYDGDLSAIASVASFFISRVDTEVDRQLEALPDGAEDLRGKAAIANGRVAYRIFRERFSGDRWQALADRGANVQRPLWASTSTKNPDYPDTAYVDSLIGPDTVNTLPDPTLQAFVDHGTVARTIDSPDDNPAGEIEAISAAGVDLEKVFAQLETEGVASFVKAFDGLLSTLQARSDDLR